MISLHVPLQQIQPKQVLVDDVLNADLSLATYCIHLTKAAKHISKRKKKGKKKQLHCLLPAVYSLMSHCITCLKT